MSPPMVLDVGYKDSVCPEKFYNLLGCVGEVHRSKGLQESERLSCVFIVERPCIPLKASEDLKKRSSKSK